MKVVYEIGKFSFFFTSLTLFYFVDGLSSANISTSVKDCGRPLRLKVKVLCDNEKTTYMSLAYEKGVGRVWHGRRFRLLFLPHVVYYRWCNIVHQ